MTGPTFVDTNIILDIATKDPDWFDWSFEQLSQTRGALIINPIIYAEVSARYRAKETVDELLQELEREDIPWDAAFLAGQAHAAYRARGGGRETILADFLIGAHAAVRGYRLLTRDGRRYRYAFPALTVIAPEGA
ncbi:type II toxin-antitoxin system VapC family toxin [Terrarubrum flagellatum]|uniref:type II toxin-antitoxin system VapC family toxin n=1 Tax=Terrirubrum flagellatum TaxID=2895980 RepID=UPI003145582B